MSPSALYPGDESASREFVMAAPGSADGPGRRGPLPRPRPRSPFPSAGVRRVANPHQLRDSIESTAHARTPPRSRPVFPSDRWKSMLPNHDVSEFTECGHYLAEEAPEGPDERTSDIHEPDMRTSLRLPDRPVDKRRQQEGSGRFPRLPDEEVGRFARYSRQSGSVNALLLPAPRRNQTAIADAHASPAPERQDG